MNRVLSALPGLVLTALLLAIWEVACRALAVPVYFLPPPSAVAIALIENGSVLAGSALQTFWMAFQALMVATVLGGGLAIAVSLSRPAEQAVAPLAVALQVTPVGGPLIRFPEDGDIQVLAGDGVSSANHGFAPRPGLALIPTGFDNEVIAIRVAPALPVAD